MLVDKIKTAFGEDLDPKGVYTSEDTYITKTWQNVMLGSTGRNTGAFYAGVEDFTALFPKFKGDFRRESKAADGSEYYAKGSFSETMLDFEELTEDESIYHVSPNALYLNELRTFERIRNKKNEKGPRVLFIRDSYFSPVIAFLSPMCHRIDAIYNLEDSHDIDIETYVKENDFDYIIVEAYPYNLGEECFNFFK